MLKNKRPIFHSEDDFKFAFSEVLSQELGNDYGVRLEMPQEIKMIKRDESKKIARAPIDIIIIDKKEKIIYPIELKYKTKKFETSFQDENYKLTNHSASDIGRFSFRKDIYRIEQLLHNQSSAFEGYFVVITNDKNYLQDVSQKNTLDKNFSFHNNAVLQKTDNSWNYEDLYKKGYLLDDKNRLINNGKLHWASKGDLFYKLDLQNEYQIKWWNYSKINNEDFYISIVRIE